MKNFPKASRLVLTVYWTEKLSKVTPKSWIDRFIFWMIRKYVGK